MTNVPAPEQADKVIFAGWECGTDDASESVDAVSLSLRASSFRDIDYYLLMEQFIKPMYGLTFGKVGDEVPPDHDIRHVVQASVQLGWMLAMRRIDLLIGFGECQSVPMLDQMIEYAEAAGCTGSLPAEMVNNLGRWLHSIDTEDSAIIADSPFYQEIVRHNGKPA